MNRYWVLGVGFLFCVSLVLRSGQGPSGSTWRRAVCASTRRTLGGRIHKAVMKEAARLVHRRTLIIVDPYWGCMATACENGGRRVVPLQFRVWSAKDPVYKNENDEIEKVVDSIRAETKHRGIYVYDRGGDRRERPEGRISPLSAGCLAPSGRARRGWFSSAGNGPPYKCLAIIAKTR